MSYFQLICSILCLSCVLGCATPSTARFFERRYHPYKGGVVEFKKDTYGGYHAKDKIAAIELAEKECGSEKTYVLKIADDPSRPKWAQIHYACGEEYKKVPSNLVTPI